MQRVFLEKAHNECMKYAQLVGYGVAIYAVMYLVWSAFVTYGFVEGYAPRIVSLLLLIGILVYAGLSLRFSRWHDILPYSIFWAVMMGVLDAIINVPYTGWQLYFDWNIWFGYVVVLVVPLLAPFFRMERTPERPPVRIQ